MVVEEWAPWFLPPHTHSVDVGPMQGMKLCVPFWEAHLQEHEWSTHLDVA